MERSLLEQLLIQNTRSYGSISSRIGFIFGRARILGSLKSVSFVRDEGSSPSFAPSEASLLEPECANLGTPVGVGIAAPFIYAPPSLSDASEAYIHLELCASPPPQLLELL